MKGCKVKDCDIKHHSKGFCSKHYQRFKAHGSTDYKKPFYGATTCRIEGCDTKHYGNGLCAKHYYRWKTTGDPNKTVSGTIFGVARYCEIEGCEEKHFGKGYCKRHYKTWKRHGDPLKYIRRKTGKHLNGEGYVLVTKPNHKWVNRKDGYILEHRLVMQEHLGRKLTSKEIVHHKNGNRQDNRLENLEVKKIHKHHAGSDYHECPKCGHKY